MKGEAGGCDPGQVLRRSNIVRSEGTSLEPANDKNPLAFSVVDDLRSGARLSGRQRVEMLVVTIDGKV